MALGREVGLGPGHIVLEGPLLAQCGRVVPLFWGVPF